jgi:hypothetical protein
VEILQQVCGEFPTTTSALDEAFDDPDELALSGLRG